MRYTKHTTYTVEMSEKEFEQYQEFLKYGKASEMEHYKSMKRQRDNLLIEYQKEVAKRKSIEKFIEKYSSQERLILK